MNIDWNDLIWSAIFFTVGWILGAIQGASWYWFPAVLLGFAGGAALWSATILVVTRVWRRVAS